MAFPSPMTHPPPNLTVAVLAYDGLCTFEFGCVVELFALDRPELGVEWYDFAVCSAERGPLRAAGGIHALHLSGAAHELAPVYADAEDINDEAVVAGVVRRHEAALLPWLDGPPQTNEAGRSSNFIAAMLWLADRRLPPRFDCLEIGSSAGINLMIDRYHYTSAAFMSGRSRA